MWPLRSLGSSDQPSLLFLHGFLGRGEDWLSVAKILSADFHILLPDLPGHGAHTGRGLNDPLSFKQLARELADSLDTAGIALTTPVGYSMGGRLALHFACTHPERCRALVLESTSPGLRAPEERANRAALDDQRAAAILSSGLPAFLESWYQADLWKSLHDRPDLLETLKGGRAGRDPAWMAKAIAELSPGRMPPLWDCLPGLNLPVLLIHGALDEKYAALAAHMLERLPNAGLSAITGAGHNTHLEAPGRFVEALQAFLYNLPQ